MGKVTCRLDDPRAAHRMPDQHDLLQPSLRHHRHDILTEGGHRPLGTVPS
jgi:hypothetical protein